MLYNFSAAILRAEGDTMHPMLFLLFGGGIKVLFTVLFTSVFGMRVEGVAIATIISNIIICVLAFCTLNGNGDICIDLRKMRLYAAELKEMLFVGLPSGLQMAMYSLANVIILTVVNGFGVYATTGVSIANQFDGIMYQIVYAPALAVIPFIAQNIGAGNIKRMRESVFKGMLITTVLGTTLGFVFVVFSRQLSSIMSETPEVIKFSQQKTIIVSSTYFLCGINEIMGGALKGMGRPIVSAVTTFLYMCLFRFLWVYMIYPICPQNLTFLYLVWPIGWILSIITLLAFYYPTIRRL